jgi:protein ImuB
MYRGRFIPEDVRTIESPSARPLAGKPFKDRSGAQRGSTSVGCVRIPDFSIAAIVRANPDLRDCPLVLTRTPSHSWNRKRLDDSAGGELSAVSAVARNYGIETGMTVAQARALIPNLIVMAPSPEAERSAIDALLDAAESISPVVEEGPPGCVWLDLTGNGRLFRHQKSKVDSEMDLEQKIAEEIATRVRRIGLEPALGIASSKEIADLAARCGGIRVIPSGREREFLDWMPLELTDFGANRELELRLKRLGIRRLGDLVRLDIQAIGSRMGEAGVKLARIARGEGTSVVIAKPRSEVYVEAIELEYGIENFEPLSFILHAMLDRICERLQLRGHVAGDMAFSLGLADRCLDDRKIVVAAPTIEVRSLLTLIILNLESTPPSAAVETVRLMVEPRIARPAQHDMFMPPMPAADRLETAIARIAALCGPDRVGMLMPADSYRPEAVRINRFAPAPSSSPAPVFRPSPEKRESTEHLSRSGEDPLRVDPFSPVPHHLTTDVRPHLSTQERAEKEGSEKWGKKSDRERSDIAIISRMALRVIRPADEIEVICNREIPDFVRGAKICARVISCAGPWRRQGEWWSVIKDDVHQRERSWLEGAPSNYARDYYELALNDGGAYRVYRDLYSEKWFVDGIYD